MTLEDSEFINVSALTRVCVSLTYNPLFLLKLSYDVF